MANAAKRELYEELGDDIQIKTLKYFGNISFDIPGGKLAVANKFITSIVSGTPRVNEPERFLKYDYLPIDSLEDYPISPDLKLLLPKLKDYTKKHC